MRKWVNLLLLAALSGLVAGLLLPGREAVGQAAISLSIDLDPAAPGIQSSREVAPGASFTVAVVAEGIPEGRPLGSFQFNLLYDDTIIRAPEVADDGRALDDNPDADDESFGTQGWDCSIYGTSFPKADLDVATGPDHGDAFLACLNVSGPFEAKGTVTLATVRFDVVASTGQSQLSLQKAVLGDFEAAELGSCNPSVYFQARCEPASVTVAQGAPSTTGEETPAAAEATAAGPEASPVATPGETPAAPEATPVATAAQPSSAGGGSSGTWPWPGVGWVLLGLVAAAAVGGVLIILRGRLVRGR